MLRTLLGFAVFIGWNTSLLAQQSRISGPIDDQRTTALRNSVHPQARAEFDQGPVDPEMQIGYATLAFRRSDRQQVELDQLLAGQQDPSSPDFHKWLTPEQFADRFAPSQADTTAVAAWLNSKGLTVNETARGRGWISFSGSAGDLQSAFRTEIHHFRVDGKLHFANAREPSIPAALEPVVQGLIGLDDFRPEPPRLATTAAGARPLNTAADGTHALAPEDLATIYDIGRLYDAGFDGTGQKLVVVGQSAIHLSDLRTFRSRFQLPPRDPIQTAVGPSPGFTVSEFEADLDLEWAGAVARNADILYVFAQSAYVAVQYAVDQNLAPVINYSFGACEQKQTGTLPVIVRALAQQANAQGITWVAASGDVGAAGCDPINPGEPIAASGLAVDFPSSIPEITAVGGTQFDDGAGNYWDTTNRPNGGSAMSYIPEIAWNETAKFGSLTATGGGSSVLYFKPFWQAGPGVPTDNVRHVPDISLAAGLTVGYYACGFGTCLIGGGTSFASPSVAGIITLLNQYLVSNGIQNQPGLSNINPRLYRLAQSTTDVFHDITGGNNIVPCLTATLGCQNGSLGYAAGPGYDLATGLGSIDAYNLVAEWNAFAAGTITTVTANPTSINLSDSTLISVTVTPTQGTAKPSGSVTLSAGLQKLGTALLIPAGNSGTATFTVYGGQLAPGNNNIIASYEGSSISDPSSGTVTVNAKLPTTNSGVIAVITPNPVYQQSPDSDGYNFFYTIRLTELAGIGTTLTGFIFDGTNVPVSSFFGAGVIPPKGTISSGARQKVSSLPSTRLFGFSGVDASGFRWTQQIPVTFLPPQLTTYINSVTNAFRANPVIAPNTWVAIKGVNLSPSTSNRIWQDADFVNGQLPTQMDGVSVTVNGKKAFMYFVSPAQVNILTPPDPMEGPVEVRLTNGALSASFTVLAQAQSLSFFEFVSPSGLEYVYGRHGSDNTLIGPASLYPGLTTPVKPGESIFIAATGFGSTDVPVVSGALAQSGNLPAPFPEIKISGIPATVSFAGLVAVGTYQINLVVPSNLPNGTNLLTATYNGLSIQPNLLITVQR